MKTNITFELTIPDDGPSLDEIKKVAHEHRYTLDAWISRCLVSGTMEALLIEDSVIDTGDIPSSAYSLITDEFKDGDVKDGSYTDNRGSS